MSNPISDLQLHVRKQLLRYAVSRAIFCPTCKGILDVRRAVLAETSALAVIECASCWEATLEGMRTRLGAASEGRGCDPTPQPPHRTPCGG